MHRNIKTRDGPSFVCIAQNPIRYWANGTPLLHTFVNFPTTTVIHFLELSVMLFFLFEFNAILLIELNVK